MDATLKVNASKVKDADGKESYERSIDFPTPKVLLVETVEELVKALGADYVLHQVKSQMKISWRSKIRNAMEKKDDNGEFEFSDDAIMKKVYDANWTPELRVVKTAEEKIDEALGAMDEAALEAYLAQKLKNMKKKGK